MKEEKNFEVICCVWERNKLVKSKRSLFSPVVFKHGCLLQTYLELWRKKVFVFFKIFQHNSDMPLDFKKWLRYKKQRNVVICNMNSDSQFFTTKWIPERIWKERGQAKNTSQS